MTAATLQALDTLDTDQTIKARMQTLSSLAATIAKNPRATLVPDSDAAPHSGKKALEALRKLRRDPAALEVLGPLGEGGMGIVSLGRQVALDRRVAIKTLRAAHLEQENIENLLGEAWLAGALEHPNVVPIYDLGLDEAGAPQLVMKRIEGDTWCDLLADPELAKRHAQGRDLLELHLGILMQVCNAVHYAHSRDVVHRDLKPDNVMVGHFGEVYVLDWGVATRPGPVKHVAGTLVYMAPEMLGGSGDLSGRTDVYLLGSVLHEVLTGRPPHDGPNMQAMVSSIVVSSPRLPADAPDELVALALACMQRDPSQRPATALDVRRAIERFLEHRGAMAIAAQAEEKLAELSALLSAEDRNVVRLYNVFGECRFGFQQALRTWPEYERARQNLRRAVAGMIDFEAEHGDARAAELLLTELDAPDRELAARVEAARRRADEEAKQIEKLKAIEKELDPRAGRRARLLGGVAFGAIWTAFPLLGPVALRSHPEWESLSTIPVSVLSLLLMFIGFRIWRAPTKINRQLMSAFAFGLAAQPVVTLTMHYGLHFDGRQYVLAIVAYWGVVLGGMAASIEWRLTPLPFAYGAAFFAVHRWPEYRHVVSAAANFIALVTAAIIWSQHATEREIERQNRRAENPDDCTLHAHARRPRDEVDPAG